MWKLIKSEFEYYKITISLVFGIMLILFVIIVGFGWESAEKDIPGISSLMLGLSIVIISIRSVKSAKEKNDRFISVLPLKRWKIALARLMFVNGFWLTSLSGLLLIMAIFHFNEFSESLFWYFISLSSIIFTFNLAPFLHKDLSSIFTDKYSKAAITAVYLVIFMSIYFLFIGTRAFTRYFSMPEFEFLSGQIHQLSPSPVAAFAFLFVSILLSLLSLFLYQKRKLYFE